MLSYGGTIGIICFLGIFERNNKEKSLESVNLKKKILSYAKNIFFVSLSAQIAIMPIIAYSYKTISLTFFITNILTSSLIGVIIIFGFVLVLISFINLEIAILFGKVYKCLIDLLEIITEYTSKIPFSKIYVKTPYLYEIVLYYIIVFTISYCYRKYGKEECLKVIRRTVKLVKDRRRKFASIILIITTTFLFMYVKVPKDLRIYFIDVGQGDSSLIITPENTKILIDGGGSETYDVGKNTLLPYILSRRITTIDYIICSHFDTDHCRTELEQYLRI